MAIKLADTLAPMSEFPAAMAEHIGFSDGATLQEKFDNKELGGGDSSVTLTQEEYEALPEEEKLDGLYYTYDTKRIYKNGVQYGASEPIPLTMEEYKALKEAGAIDEQQEYLIEAGAEGILLDAEDIGYNNAGSGIQATTVQGAIDKVAEKVDSKAEINDTSSSTTSTYSSTKINELNANRQVKTFDNTGTSTEKWYKICSALTTGIGCNINLTASRADSTATVQYFSALFRDSRYRYTSSYISRERTVYESALIAEYSAYIIADANNDIWVHVPSYGKAIIEIDTRAVTIDGTAGTPVEDYVYNSFEHQYDGRINDSATDTSSTWSSSKIASTMPTTRSLTLKTDYAGYITEVYDPTTKVVVYNVNINGTFKGLGNAIATGFKIPKDATSSADVMHTTLGIYGAKNVSTGDAQFTRLLIRNYSNPFFDVDIQGEYLINGTITYITA